MEEKDCGGGLARNVEGPLAPRDPGRADPVPHVKMQRPLPGEKSFLSFQAQAAMSGFFLEKNYLDKKDRPRRDSASPRAGGGSALLDHWILQVYRHSVHESWEDLGIALIKERSN